MTRFLFSLIALLLCLNLAGKVEAQPQAATRTTTAEDRRLALQYLQSTHEKFLAALNNLSEAQWKFKAAPERWSIAEIAEHIVLAEDQLYGFVTNRLMKAPLAADAKRSAISDQQVIAATNDRSKQFSANDRGLPTGRWSTKEEVLKNAASHKNFCRLISVSLNTFTTSANAANRSSDRFWPCC